MNGLLFCLVDLKKKDFYGGNFAEQMIVLGVL
jgi:hypothetical protein